MLRLGPIFKLQYNKSIQVSPYKFRLVIYIYCSKRFFFLNKKNLGYQLFGKKSWMLSTNTILSVALLLTKKQRHSKKSIGKRIYLASIYLFLFLKKKIKEEKTRDTLRVQDNEIKQHHPKKSKVIPYKEKEENKLVSTLTNIFKVLDRLTNVQVTHIII